MKTLKYSLILLGLSAVLGASGADAGQKTKTLKAFTTTDPTISKDVAVTADQTWAATCTNAQVIHLFEVAKPGVEDCMVIYRVKLKTEGLSGPAYLEMWCRFPGKGEFFSRDLEHPISGSNDWASFETPFFLKKGEQPDLIKLNVVVKGGGKVWVKDVELIKAPLPTGRGK